MLLSPEDRLLLSVVKIHPTQDDLQQIDDLLPQITDWETFTRLLIAHGSGPLFYKKIPLLLNAQLIPLEVKAKLQQAYYRTLIRSTILYEAFRQIGEELQKNGISFIALKGIYLSEVVYGDIALRQFSDIDILIPEMLGKKTLAVLQNIGYKPWEQHGIISNFVTEHSDFVHYTPMQKGDISVEVHIKLHSQSNQYKLSIPDIWERAEDSNIHKQGVKVLSLEDLLMHLCIHADKHFTVGHIQLKSFNDIVNLLDTLKSGFDWERFESMCLQYKCEKIVFKYFVLLVRYYQAYLPEKLFEKYACCLTIETEKLFIDYLHGESFEVNNKSAVPTHINSLRNMKSSKLFIIYLIEVLFPPKSFMMQKYNPQPLKGCKNSPLGVRGKYWWLWYSYRWWVGVKGLFYIIGNSISKK